MFPLAAQIGSSTNPEVGGRPYIVVGSNVRLGGGVPTPAASRAARSAASETLIGPPPWWSAASSSARIVDTKRSLSCIDDSRVASAVTIGASTP